MTIAAYNFARPARLPGEGQQRLTTWFRSALKLVGRAWAKEIAFEATGELREVDVVHAKEVFGKLPERMTGYRILLAGEELPTLLLLPRPLLVALISALLGEAIEEKDADRDLTVVEQSLAEYFLQTLWLPYFKDTWPSQNQVIWQLSSAEPVPQRTRLFDADEPVASFSWVMQTPLGEQACLWLFRKKGLEQLLGTADEDQAPLASVGPRLEGLVRSLPLDVIVHLGSVELRLSQLGQLRAGDVILLNQRVSEPLTVILGEKQKFRGWGGRSGLSRAIQIDSLLDE